MSKDDENPGSSEFARLLENSFKKPQKRLAVGDKVRSEILVMGKEEVFVSTGPSGATRDGIVLMRDLLDENGKVPYKVGDTLDLYVTQFKGSDIFLSPKSTSQNFADDLEDAYDMMLPMEGKVTEACKGGVRVLIQGKSAFCPISQLDIVRVEGVEDYIGKKLEFRITQFSEGGRNIVVSRRKILEEQREVHQGEFADNLKPGSVFEGTVKKIETFGAFVEISPGVEGLVHISELSWTRVKDPHEVVEVGQKIKVKVLRTENQEKLKISLSMREAGEDPWAALAEKFAAGTPVSGKVERREPYGLFIQLGNGMTGLLPKSKANEHPEFPFEKLKVGSEVMVQIDQVNARERRISLTVPQDPNRDDWKNYAAPTSSGSFGTLAEQFKAALQKKK